MAEDATVLLPAHPDETAVVTATTEAVALPAAVPTEEMAIDSAIALERDAEKGDGEKKETPVVNAVADDKAAPAADGAAQANGGEKDVDATAIATTTATTTTMTTTTTAMEAAADSKVDKPAAPTKKVATAPPPSAKKKATPKPSRKKSVASVKKGKATAADLPDVKYEVGQCVMAKMRGFPPWPAIILSKELLPEIMVTKPSNGNSKALESLGEQAWSAQYPIFYMGTYEYSWMAVSDLEPLTKERIEAGASGRKAKKLVEAFQEAAEGFTLENVKQVQAATMEVDDETAAEAEAEDEMDVDDEEEEALSGDEKPKKAARGKKRKKSETASDGDEEPEKPAKTPKKAPASKAKTPRTASKATPAAKAKTPKTPANGVKASAKKTPVAKEKAATPAAAKKKATPAKSKKATAKSKEVVESDTEGSVKSEDNAVDVKTLSPSQQHRYILHRRHKLQKAFLNKEKAPPRDEEMAELSKLLRSLEEWADMPADLIKSTKIHKVLRGIKNVEFAIPLEDEFTFKARCEPLLASWMETIRAADREVAQVADEAEKAEEPAKEEEVQENGVNGDAAAAPVTEAKDDAPAVPQETSAAAPEKRTEEVVTTATTKEVVMRDAGAAPAEEKKPEGVAAVAAEAPVRGSAAKAEIEA